jgi:glutamine synthetase
MPKQKSYEFIDLKYVDLLGKLRHVTFPYSNYKTAQLVGIGFDSSSLKGFKKTEKSDMVLIPSLENAFIDPFYSDPTLSIFAKIYYIDRKTRYEREPRYILEKAIDLVIKELKLEEILFLAELEFYVFSQFEISQSNTKLTVTVESDEKESALTGSYHSAPPHDLYAEHRNKLAKLLKQCGIDVKYHHHEGGEFGQMEIETTFKDAAKTADNIIVAKYLIKNYFRSQGKYVTFMPKPIKNRHGSGMHYHHILEKNGHSIFKGAKGELSQIGEYYVSGILSHLAALAAFTNPTTNSYKRLTGGFETAKDASIGIADRTSAIRIPGYAKDQMPIEYRVGDATCNPYLALAALLLAGLDGVRNKGKLKKGFVPTSLQDAVNELKKDSTFLTRDKIFVPELIDFWVQNKTRENLEIQHTPHPLEFVYYFNM